MTQCAKIIVGFMAIKRLQTFFFIFPRFLRFLTFFIFIWTFITSMLRVAKVSVDDQLSTHVVSICICPSLILRGQQQVFCILFALSTSGKISSAARVSWATNHPNMQLYSLYLICLNGRHSPPDVCPSPSPQLCTLFKFRQKFSENCIAIRSAVIAKETR